MITTSLLVSLLPQAQPTLAVHAVPQTTPGIVERVDDRGMRAIVKTNSGASPIALQSTTAAWQALGPFGGDISDVAASPTAAGVVLAGSNPSSGAGTLYRSTDGGVSWSEVSALAGIDVYDIEFAANGTAYVGTLDGIWRSTNDGASWTNLPLGIGLNDGVREVTLDPSDPQRIWVGVDDALGNQTQNVLRSTNGGASWANVTPPGAAGTGCTGIAIDPASTSRVALSFAGSFSGGAVYVSTNGGTTWVNRSAGLPGNPLNDIHLSSGRMYVVGGLAFGSQFVGVYASVDLGVSWTALHNASWPSLIVNDIEVDPTNPNRVLVATGGAGVFASSNGGSTWSFGVGGTGGLSVNEISLDPQVAGRAFLGASSNAVWRSTNNLATFLPSSVGIAALDVYSIAENPNNAAELAIAFQGLNDGGVYTSTDAGLNWTLEPLPGTRYNTVGFAPNGTLYAISDGPTTIAAEGLYRRSGGSWTSLGPNQGPVFESELFALRFSQNDPNLILLGGGDFGVAGFEGTVWRSTNAGATWTKVFEGAVDFERIQDIEFVENGLDQVALACFTHTSSPQEGGVLRSTNGGVAWVESNAGLPLGVQGVSLTNSPTSATRFFLSSNGPGPNGGVFETTNGGQSWTNTGTTTRTQGLEADPNDPNVLYASGFDQPRLRISKDAGMSFVAFDDGASAAGTIRSLSLSEGGARLYAAASTGAWRTPTGASLGAPFCAPGVPNSTGSPSTIAASGSSIATANDLELTVTGLPPFQFVLFLASETQDIVPNPGGSQGTLCLGGAIGRFNNQIVNAGAAGVASIPVDLTAVPQPSSVTAVTAGETWTFQAWHRDINPGQTSNFSDAVEITFQ